jgi:hypothetical protein
METRGLRRRGTGAPPARARRGWGTGAAGDERAPLPGNGRGAEGARRPAGQPTARRRSIHFSRQISRNSSKTRRRVLSIVRDRYGRDDEPIHEARTLDRRVPVDTPHPALSLVTSSQLSEKTEAGTIARILESIVAEHRRAAA